MAGADYRRPAATGDHSRMPTISLCMIVRDEAEVLERCLQSAAGIAEEIIVVDTGSTDDTVAIAERNGARVAHFEWVDDFSAARNYSFELATMEYILWLDADDVVLPEQRERLLELKARLASDVYYIRYDYAQDGYGQSVCLLYRERLVRNRPDIRWLDPVHEFLSTANCTVERVDITITHRRTSEGCERDRGRNLRMLRRAVERPEYRENPRARCYLARELQDCGEVGEAVDAWKRFLEIAPAGGEDRALALARLASCYLLLGNGERKSEYRGLAREACRESWRIAPHRAEAAYLLGTLAWEEKDADEAILWFSRIPAELPHSNAPVETFAHGVGRLSGLCLAHDGRGEYRKANYYNELALRLWPSDAGFLQNRVYFRGRLQATEIRRIAFGAAREGFLHATETPEGGADDCFPLQAVPWPDDALASIACTRVPSGDESVAVYAEWLRVLERGGEVLLTAEAHGGTTNVAAGLELERAGFIVDYAWQDGERLAVRAVKPVRPERIGFLCAPSSPDAPVHRIRALNLAAWLRARGYRVTIQPPETFAETDVAVFYPDFSAGFLDAVRRARADGRRVIVDVAEDLLDLDVSGVYRATIEAADLVVACSHRLVATLRAMHPNVIVSEDPVEVAWEKNCAYDGRRRLTIGWIGMGWNAGNAERLRPLIEAAGHQLVTIHDGPGADVPWRLDTWQDALARCDAAVVPLDVALQPSKSSNRITACMALGLPVIASPLDAYLRLIGHGRNGLIASTDEEWRAALEQLRDPRERERIGRAGKETARRHAIGPIAARWVARVLGPDVDIVIPTCGSDAHLAACLDAVEAATDVPYRVTIVDSAARGEPLRVPEGMRVIRSEERLDFAAAVNRGIAAGDAPFLCILNDDTIPSRGWLGPLVERVRRASGICNPLSNYRFGQAKVPSLRLDGHELAADGHELADGRVSIPGGASISVERLHGYHPGLSGAQDHEWVPFFCTVMTRALFDRVGQLDEGFRNSHEDIDYCLRVRRLGLPTVVDERAFVFHFGGITRCAISDRTEIEAVNTRRLEAKYSLPLVVIHAGRAHTPWNPASIDDGGVGGAETATVRMAEELAKRGSQVVVFADCEGREGRFGDVEWVHYPRFESFASITCADVFVASRFAEILRMPVRTNRRYLWLHDVHAINAKEGEQDLVRNAYPDLNAILCLSPWHRDFAAGYHGIGTEKIVVTRNGIDPERFRFAPPRRRHRFIYSSSPDRGLDVLLEIFPRIRAALGDAELHVFYGFDVWERSLADAPKPVEAAHAAWIRERIRQPGVVFHGRVGQRRLARELARSDVWLYPTNFLETYCITALEAQMAGVACICTDLAGLKTTVGERGILLEGSPYSEEYRDRAVAATLELLADRPRRNRMTRAARAWAASQSWAAVAGEWIDMFRSH
jgi:glycosyltransferase involved in cell wall biosynthesis/tetratricopeptide (TPR) repeat protein